MPDDAPFDEGEAEEKRRLDQELALADLRDLLRNPQFERYILRFLQSYGIFSHAFIGSAEVHYQMGRKSVAMDVLNQIKAADPERAAGLILRTMKTDDR